MVLPAASTSCAAGRAEHQGMLCNAKQGLQLGQSHLLRTGVGQNPVLEVCRLCRPAAEGFCEARWSLVQTTHAEATTPLQAGEGEDGRLKSAIGIGSLLMDGLGDTIRVSLTEDPEYEIEPCR